MSRHRIQHYHVHHDDPRQHHFNLTLADQIAPRGYISWIFALPAVGVREAHHRSAVFQRVSLIVHAMYATDRFLRRYVVQRTEPTSYIDILTQNMARNDCTGVVELTDIEPTMPNASDLAKRTALPSGDASGLVPMPSQAERGHSSWLAPAEVFSPGCKTARLGYGSLPDPVPQRVFRVLVGFGIDTFNLTFQLHHSVGDDYCLTFLIEDFAARSLNDDDQLRQVTEARPYDSDRRDRYPHEDKQAAGPLESHEYVHRGDSYVTTDDFAERRGRSHYNSAYRYHQELSTLNLSLSIIAMSLAHVSTVTPSGFNPFAQMQHAIGTPPRNQSNMRLVILDALLWANITRARVSTGELAGGQDGK